MIRKLFWGWALILGQLGYSVFLTLKHIAGWITSKSE